MHEDLFPYYENELSYLRQAGVEFAEKYPAEAGALKLERNRCDDPHVERVLEGVAFLSARIKRKLDDELPELTEPLLDLLCPHMVMPVPPVGIMQFNVGQNAGKLSSGYHIPRGTKVQATPIGGVACEFRTSYAVDLVPLAIKKAGISRCSAPREVARHFDGAIPQAQLDLTLEAIGGIDVGALNPNKIRLHLTGNPLAFRLYEVFTNNLLGVEVFGEGEMGTSKHFYLDEDAVTPVGFAEEEALLPAGKNSFEGYRLLHEYFAFQEKFLFFDIATESLLQKMPNCSKVTFRFYLKMMPAFMGEQTVSADNFLLGCTPIINLFEKRAEPFKTDLAKREYQIIPEVSRRESYEVYSVKSVDLTDLHTSDSYRLEPFYSFRHTLSPEKTLYWYTRKEKALDGADEHNLNFCSLGFEPVGLLDSTVSLKVLCSNRDVVKKLDWRSGRSRFIAEDIPVFGPLTVVSLQSESLRTPLGRDDEFWNNSKARRNWQGGHWRLISHLSLNYLTINDGGIEGLRALLQLYDIKGLVQHENMILGLVNISTKTIGALVNGAYCRGLEVTLAVDPDRFGGTSAMLLTAILDIFFGRYATINSIIRLKVVDNTEKRSVIKQWPTRSGNDSTL